MAERNWKREFSVKNKKGSQKFFLRRSKLQVANVENGYVVLCIGAFDNFSCPDPLDPTTGKDILPLFPRVGAPMPVSPLVLD